MQVMDVKSESVHYNNNNNNNNNNKRKRKYKRKNSEDDDLNLYFSERYTVYLIVIWVIFILVFISGFIVHFDTEKNVTASSILWTFSGILCFFGIVFSYIYYKSKNAKTPEEMNKYLKYFPC
jgi:hypothetical protein